MKPILAILATLATSAIAAPGTAQLEAVAAAREQRVALLRDELKAQDTRIEARIDAILTALQSITDSKDTRTKVTRMKEQTIDGLMKNLEYFRQKRAALLEELRRPTLRLTEEQKRKAVAVFDERIEKRVAQILSLQKSFPSHQDYARYNVHGGGDGGPTFTVNEDHKQNARLSSRTNAQRDELTAGLRKSIERIEQQNRALKAQNAPADEIAKNDALLAERRKQLAAALAPAGTSAREVGKKEAADLDTALRKAIAELRGEFTSLFARYHALLGELQSLNPVRGALAAAKQ